MSKASVKIIMGSGGDLEFCKKIGKVLDEFRISYKYRVASAHKTPEKVLEVLSEDKEDLNLVYITVAGRSNALSGFVDFNTPRPVIACPPYSERFGGVDIFSSLRMPSGAGALTVIEPEAAAIAATKMLGLRDEQAAKKIKAMQDKLKEKISKADKEVGKHGKR